MRIVLLLIVLAVIGLTLARWLGEPPPTAPVPPPPDSTAAPAVPTRPQDLKPFECVFHASWTAVPWQTGQ